MSKVNLRKELAYLYNPSAREVSVVDVPQMYFLMIDGRGDPNTSDDYAEALEALYAVSYAIKFRVKRTEGGVDYAVMPLEGLWWTDEMREFSVEAKSSWKWTAVIMQPEWYVTDGLVEEAKTKVERKKGLPPSRGCDSKPSRRASRPRSRTADPGPTIERIHRHIEERGGEPRGKHHEIYLGDFRRTKPERLRTVIRHPYVLRAVY